MRPANLLLFLLILILNAGIFRVTADYMHVDGNESFLIGKETPLENPWFHPALIIHGFSSSISLLFVSLLVLFRIEKYRIHRIIGKSTMLLLVFLAFPSGLFLSYYASGGPFGKFLFVMLSFYTIWAVINGYLAIRKKQIQAHRSWMIELLILLCSAIVLRLFIVFFVMVFNWQEDAMYLTAALLSWIPWVLIFKLVQSKKLQGSNNL